MPALALVPVQQLDRAKSRLAPAFEPTVRQTLVQTLLVHVVTVLQAAPSVGTVVVVTPDRAVLALAEQRGARGLWQAAGELNEAVRQGQALAQAEGWETLLVVLGDLPRLTVANVTALLALADTTTTVLAPDRHGQGTNLLAWPAAIPLNPQFGPGSRWRHRLVAARAALSVREYWAWGTAADCDTPDDVVQLGLLPVAAVGWDE
jgi:2-phospho-L-lactate guanylyltransferase